MTIIVNKIMIFLPKSNWQHEIDFRRNKDYYNWTRKELFGIEFAGEETTHVPKQMV